MLWIRRRLSSGDEGMTLVEMLVALFVLSVGLMALLGSFLTSARSLQHQEDRSQAQRATLEVNEHLRSLDFEAVASGEGEIVTKDGETMRYVSEVTEEEVEAPDGATATVKRVVTTVYYSVRGVEHAITFTTTISPNEGFVAAPDPSASPSPSPSASGDPDSVVKEIVSLSLSPEPTVVDASGRPTKNVLVTAVLNGYEASELVTATWTDDNGSQSVVLSSGDGSSWSATILAASIKKVVPAGGTSSLSFTAKTTDGLTSTKALQVKGPPTTPPPVVIELTNSSGNVLRADNKTGRLEEDVTFTCFVNGLPPADAPHTVRLVYYEFNGVQKELAMSPNAANDVWTLVVKAGSQVTFKLGNKLAFTCNATRSPDFGPGSLTDHWNVT